MNDPFKIIEPTVISFSGGRTSAYMLWRVLQSNNGLPDDAIVVFANTGKEDEATLKFVFACENNWNVPIHWIEYRNNEQGFEKVGSITASRNGEPFQQAIEKYKKLPNPAQRWCTGILKIRTIHKYVKSLGFDHHETENSDFIGIRYDEPRRAAKMPKEKVPLYVDKITKKDILNFWSEQRFDLNIQMVDGEAIHGNCDLCFLKSLPKIKTIINHNPEKAIWWAKMEALVPDMDGVKAGNGTKFRTDRPSYAELINNKTNQGNLFEEDIPCFCGD
jgi:3'-phosphoadenosine 5'-phosphosulfate sulfotransferase (PAPS reductase)/FAD synthetase